MFFKLLFLYFWVNEGSKDSPSISSISCLVHIMHPPDGWKSAGAQVISRTKMKNLLTRKTFPIAPHAHPKAGEGHFFLQEMSGNCIHSFMAFIFLNYPPDGKGGLRQGIQGRQGGPTCFWPLFGWTEWVPPRGRGFFYFFPQWFFLLLLLFSVILLYIIIILCI